MRTKQEIRQAVEQNAERLRKLVGLASWWDGADQVLTDREREDVSRLWETMDGRTCWNDAFLKWIKAD